MAPIPIALCGKNLEVAKNFSSLMLPEYEVVHVCQTTETAISELAPLLNGEPIKPASSVGSNVDASAVKTPKALFVGGGWTNEAIDEMRASDSVMTSIPYVHPGKEFMAAQSVPPQVGGIVERLKAVFEEEGLATGRMENVVYSF